MVGTALVRPSVRGATPAVRVAANRGTVVDFRRGGMLGVSGEPAAERCSVAQVVPGSAAARAGIKSGDVITRCDDEEVDNFTTLTRLLSDKASGEKVQLTFGRRGQSFSKEITLGEWTRE